MKRLGIGVDEMLEKEGSPVVIPGGKQNCWSPYF